MPGRRLKVAQSEHCSPLVLRSVLFYSAGMTALIYPTTNLTQVEQLNIVRGDGIYVYDKRAIGTLRACRPLVCSARLRQ